MPYAKYDQYIRKGYGNCAQRAAGYSYHLLKHGCEFYTVDFVDLQRIDDGVGHTILWVGDNDTASVLIDADNSGIVSQGGKTLTLPELIATDYTALYLVDDFSNYLQQWYEGQGVKNHTVLLTASQDLPRYYQFVKTLCPLKNNKEDKIFCDGLALLAGYYPHKLISTEQYTKLIDSQQKYCYYLAKLCIYLSRLLVFLLAVILVVKLWQSTKLCSKRFIFQSYNSA